MIDTVVEESDLCHKFQMVDFEKFHEEILKLKLSASPSAPTSFSIYPLVNKTFDLAVKEEFAQQHQKIFGYFKRKKYSEFLKKEGLDGVYCFLRSVDNNYHQIAFNDANSIKEKKLISLFLTLSTYILSHKYIRNSNRNKPNTFFPHEGIDALRVDTALVTAVIGKSYSPRDSRNITCQKYCDLCYKKTEVYQCIKGSKQEVSNLRDLIWSHISEHPIFHNQKNMNSGKKLNLLTLEVEYLFESIVFIYLHNTVSLNEENFLKGKSKRYCRVHSEQYLVENDGGITLFNNKKLHRNQQKMPPDSALERHKKFNEIIGLKTHTLDEQGELFQEKVLKVEYLKNTSSI